MRTFDRIIVDIDPHAVHHPELDRGVAIARATHAELIIAAVMTPRDVPPVTGGKDTDAVDHLKSLLQIVAAGVGEVRVSTTLLFGPPAEVLAEEAHRTGADLLIRSHPRDTALAAQRRSGIDRDLIRTCPAPVLLVGPGIAATHPRVLGAVAPDTGWRNTAALNRAVIDYTLTIAAVEAGTPTLLQAFMPPALQLAHASGVETAGYVEHSRTEVTSQLAAAVRDLGEDPRHLALIAEQGVVEEVLPAFVVSHGIDLVVLGIPPRRGPARWILGTTAERLVRHMPCSVLAVKPDPHTSRTTRALVDAL
ncbi:Universal stress protein E homolog [Nocardia otitidiscaviarum]|uniref:Universal stress protein E homolog n=1 Tax=Nocardia otitidiscaviarum TaxID=1823 RepID=A0A378Y6X7_9NOCA|nr:universal stress protein [Nocardia otitidiscaviarum]MBF6241527.1 universal stress protein [Nocardia otitidiscaviarum]SUA72844.1 Universal stress protein E homolog [Nocardia otitidiscaviarum]